MKFHKSYILAKKEIRHSLKDSRVMLTILLTTLVFYPSLMIGITYFQEESVEDVQSNIPTIIVKGVELQEFEEKFGPTPFEIVKEDDAKSALLNNKVEGILNLSINNNEIESNYQYKASSSKSLASQEKMKEWFSLVEKKQTQNFINELNNVDTSSLKSFNFQSSDVTPESQKGKFITVIPYLILIGINVGIMSIGIDTTAGEKEKKTLITLLSSSQNHNEIAFGKMASTSFFGIITSSLTIMGFILGSFISKNILNMQNLINIDMYTFLLLLVILVPVSLLLSNLILILGTISKSVKEANSYTTPLFIIIIFVGMVSSMIGKEAIDLKLSIIPIVGNVLSVKSILMGEISKLFVSLSVLTTILYTIILLFIFIYLFRKEKFTLL